MCATSTDKFWFTGPRLPAILPQLVGPLRLVLVASSILLCSLSIRATSVVALLDSKNDSVVIAADCRVNRTVDSLSECKIIDKPGCTVAIAGLYREKTTAFDLRKLVDAACQYPGDLRAKAEAFLRISRIPYERAVRHIRNVEGGNFGRTAERNATEVIFAGIQDGHVALIVRGLLADSAGRISFERFESVAPSYTRAGYFLGLNGHIRAHVNSHPDWMKEDHVGLAHRFVEMEMEAHPDSAGPPISEVQIDKDGHVHWLDKGACESRPTDPTARGIIAN